MENLKQLKQLNSLSIELETGNKLLSEKAKELDEEIKRITFSKSHYTTVMALSDEVLKAASSVEEIMERLSNAISDVEDDKLDYLQKQRILQKISQSPIEAMINEVLDIKNLYKEKFSEKQRKISELNEWHRMFLFYTHQADPSIMEIDFG